MKLFLYKKIYFYYLLILRFILRLFNIFYENSFYVISMPRSGSTYIFENLYKNCIKYSNKNVITIYVKNDFELLFKYIKLYKKNSIFIIKSHRPLAFSMIKSENTIYLYRNINEVINSAIRMKFLNENNISDNIISWLFVAMYYSSKFEIDVHNIKNINKNFTSIIKKFIYVKEKFSANNRFKYYHKDHISKNNYDIKDYSKYFNNNYFFKNLKKKYNDIS